MHLGEISSEDINWIALAQCHAQWHVSVVLNQII